MTAQKLVVLISGRGSNLKAILESAIGGQVAAVLSDNPDAPGLAFARARGAPAHVCDYAAYPSRADFEAALLRHIRAEQPALIALAGFMRVLSAAFIRACGAPIVNIHPSLLPDFRGLHTHRRALAAGRREHGCTVHYVNEEVDGGAVIASDKIAVRPGEDECSLAARVLEKEHALYPSVLAELLAARAESA